MKYEYLSNWGKLLYSVVFFSCKWDLESGRKLCDIQAHNGDVVSISLSSDGNSFVTGSVDRSCRLWDIREEKPKQTFFGHESDVNSVCVSININNNKITSLFLP